MCFNDRILIQVCRQGQAGGQSMPMTTYSHNAIGNNYVNDTLSQQLNNTSLQNKTYSSASAPNQQEHAKYLGYEAAIKNRLINKC